MAEAESFVIVIWIHDYPVTGNTIRLRQIVDPRKRYSDYHVGEKVKAKLARFGLVEGVIGKIGDDSELQKKEFDQLIDSAEFSKMVGDLHSATEVLTHVPQEANSTVPASSKRKSAKKSNTNGATDVQLKKRKEGHSTNEVPTHVPQEANSTVPASSKQKLANKSKTNGATDVQSKKRKEGHSTNEVPTLVPQEANSTVPASSKQKLANKSKTNGATDVQSKKRKFDLEKAAADLELQELKEKVQEESTSKDTSVASQSNTSSVIGEALSTVNTCTSMSMLDLLNEPLPAEYPGTVHGPAYPCGCACAETVQQLAALKQETAGLRQHLEWLAAKFTSKNMEIQQLQGNVSWLYQNNQGQTQNFPVSQESIICNRENQMNQGPAQKPSETFGGQVFGSSERTNLQDLTNQEKPVTENTYNDFTKAQLRSFITRSKTYSKATKCLFRRLFSEKEIEGRSVTGTAPNKSTPSKPALEGQDKLTVLYEIVQEKFAFASKAMINAKIADLLKPSHFVKGH